MISSSGIRFRKAVLRGDPRVGLLLGSAAALVIAALFAWRVTGPVERLELAAIDTYFRWRPARPASEQVTLIYFDDVAARHFKTIKRRDSARVLRALTRLGAKRVAFDVEYVSDFSAAPPGEDGSLPANEETRFLAHMMEAGGRSIIVYNFEKEPAFADPARARAEIDRLKQDLRRELPPGEREALDAEFAELQQVAARERVEELLAADPGLGYPAILDRLLAGRRDHPVAGDLLRAFHGARAMALLAERRTPIQVETAPPGMVSQGMAKPTVLDLAARVRTAGHATTPSRDLDGVLRRAPLLLATPAGILPYMGLEAAASMMEEGGERLRITLRPGEVVVEGPKRLASLPVLADGTTLVDWSGRFTALSFARLWEEDHRRTTLLMANLDRAIAGLGSFLGATKAGELKAALDAVAADFANAEADLRVPVSRLDQVELALGTLTGEVVDALKADAAKYRGQVEKMAPRMREAFLPGVLKREEAAKELEAARSDDPDLRRRIDGRLCFIGSASTAGGDLYSTPEGGQTPGVNLHAEVAAMVLEGRSLRVASPWLGFTFVALTGLAVAGAVMSGSLFRSALLTIVIAAASIAAFFGVAVRMSLLLPGAGPVAGAAAVFTIGVSWRELVARRSQRRLQKELERHTSPSLVSIIMADPERFSRPRKTTATIFFSDIKGFTSIAEKMDAEALIHFMNRYHDRMTQILKDRQAYLDKYIGDGIMALFGVPVETPDHARQACRAALENVRAADLLADEFEREGLPRVSIRVGLNSGDIVAAYVGASDRADYTAVGDAVNLASRLEGANKMYETRIMVSESTYLLVRDAFRFRELDRIRVVGKEQGIRVYELLAEQGIPVALSDGFLAAYQGAMQAFTRRDWAAAKAAFEEALLIEPEDLPAQIHLKRCAEFIPHPPAADWDGVFDLESK